MSANPCPWCRRELPGIKRIGYYQISTAEVKRMAEDVGIDKLVLPVLKLHEQYSTHPKTEAVVANWCQGSGPCRCITKKQHQDDVCFESTSPLNGGCKCKTPAPEEAWFFGWCYKEKPTKKPDRNGKWKYIDEEVQWPALGAKVVHFPSSTADDRAPWKGVIRSYDDTNGWTIEGETLKESLCKEQNFFELNVERLYICCDYYGDPIS